MKLPDSFKKYIPVRTDNLSIFGRGIQGDWNVIVVFFIVSFIALCVLAGVCYYWIAVSVFPEDLVPNPSDSVDTTIFTHDKAVIGQAQAYLQAKAQQLNAAR